jgi:hypothetical protein
MTLENADLDRQWKLFLDVLEEEGSMGFTKPNADLFTAWAQQRGATVHVEGFVEMLRDPILVTLNQVLDPALGVTDFYRGRGGRPVLSRAAWGKADMPIVINGERRLRVGVFGYNPPARFFVAPNEARRWVAY